LRARSPVIPKITSKSEDVVPGSANQTSIEIDQSTLAHCLRS
jgi:hypothetical protein